MVHGRAGAHRLRDLWHDAVPAAAAGPALRQSEISARRPQSGCGRSRGWWRSPAAVVLSTANRRPIIATPETLSAPDRAVRISKAPLKKTEPEATALDGFLIMLRSISNQRAVEIARAVVESHHQKNVTEALSGPDAAERAALLMSLVAGVQIMRQVVGLDALSKDRDAALERVLGDLVARLVE
ncbi:hypothetical protein IB267_05205 [Ensifer sp. ENS09]|nr:hypothetical protein [Ensifer sp. ENS09]MBD9647749.1 hypothetical protein [Ensifer sp. ENS09]